MSASRDALEGEDMNTYRKLGLVLGAALLLPVACSDDAADVKVRKEISEAGSATAEYAAKKIETWKEDLRELDVEISAWKAKAEAKAASATDDTKARMEEALAALKTKRDALAEKIEDAGDKTADAWSDVEAGFQRAWGELEESFADAKRKFE